MGSGKKAPGSVTRRALLVVGGVTLLAGYARRPTEHVTGAANSTPAADRSPAPSPAASPAAGPARSASAPPSRTGLPGKESARKDPPGSRPPRKDPVRPRPGRPRPPGRDRHGNGEPMFQLNDGPKVIALTIDDGPSPVYTPQILRLLDKYQVTATFSMVGLEVAAYPAMAREVKAAGHKIINHTWSHIDLAHQPPAVIADQMSLATAAIHKATGRMPDMFRAPYGAWSAAILQQCAQDGMAPLAWSVDPRDWSRPGVASIVGNIMRNTKTGSIILEHDGGGNRSQTVAALKIVLPRLLAEGYHFTTP